VRVVQLVVVVVVLLYLYVAWLRGNGGEQAHGVPLISEVQDEIRSLNIDDFQFQGEEGENYKAVEENTDLIPINNDSFTPLNIVSNDAAVYPLTNGSFGTRTKKKPPDPTILHNKYMYAGPSKTSRYLFVLGHYEQLGKTTINFLHARYMAGLMNRDLIVPYVRNSRYCGLKEGWIGQKRKKSREFFSMENYFDMSSMEQLSPVSPTARLVGLEEYYDKCSSSGISMIYFVYAFNHAENKKYLQLNDAEYETLRTQMEQHNGWYECTHIEKKLNTRRRINNISITRAICVDPETIVSVNALEELVHDEKCVSIFLWRGIGKQRTHFNLSFPELHANYLSNIEFSTIVHEEADKFLAESFHAQPFISIQIRSERQLSWYSLDKFKQCLDLVVKVVNILIEKKKITRVFVSSDLEKHGSDQISMLLNSTTQAEAKQHFHRTVDSLHAVLYKPDKSRGLVYNDAGFVALTQMEILSRSRYLVTVGDGTYQRWLVALFKKNKKKLKNSWNLTRVCATELKRGTLKKS